jgi:dTDP-D-glucose 4,6-dehydratase
VTHGLDVRITRCSNNFGVYQYPEKVIPLFITNLMEGKKVPLYGDGLNVRDWLHVDDHCRGIQLVIDKGRTGQIYNIGGGTELSNIDFSQVLETSIDTVRKSVDQTKTFVKWEGSIPSSINLLTTKEGPYTYEEILTILSGPEWTDPNPMI